MEPETRKEVKGPAFTAECFPGDGGEPVASLGGWSHSIAPTQRSFQSRALVMRSEVDAPKEFLARPAKLLQSLLIAKQITLNVATVNQNAKKKTLFSWEVKHI